MDFKLVKNLTGLEKKIRILKKKILWFLSDVNE